MLSIAATPTPFRITYRSRGPVSIENRTCRKLKCSMHLTGAHVFTDGQPFTLTASISPLTVYAVFQDTRDPSPRSSPRFVRPRRRGDGQRTVEQAFCNVTSFPSPLVRRGSHEVRTIIVPTRSIAISISKQSPRESLRLMRHYIYAARNRGGFLRAERTLCAPLPRILFSERDVFRVPGQPRFPPRLCALPSR